MDTQKYSYNRFLLRFHTDDVEQAYCAGVIDTTLIYSRMAWVSVILFGGVFGFLDVNFFKESAAIIITARITLLCLAALMLGLSWWRPARPMFKFYPSIFILGTSTFCILQTGLSPEGSYSPYIMGVFLAFCGTFCTVGMGFAYSFFALLASVVIFEILIGLVFPIEPYVFLVYNFFYMCFTLVFIFLGYVTEILTRKSFIVSKQLQDSLAEVKTLSGMLPICAACKKIRDDGGYWNQIEAYLASHTEVAFSHGICPDCIKQLYPDLELS